MAVGTAGVTVGSVVKMIGWPIQLIEQTTRLIATSTKNFAKFFTKIDKIIVDESELLDITQKSEKEISTVLIDVSKKIGELKAGLRNISNDYVKGYNLYAGAMDTIYTAIQTLSTEQKELIRVQQKYLENRRSVSTLDDSDDEKKKLEKEF